MTRLTPDSQGMMGPPPPLVGRTAERVLLAEALGELASGLGHVVIVGGEAGIGKTTIARDLVRRARALGYHTIVGHSHDLTAAPPYGLWLDLGDDYRHAGRAPEMPPLPDVLSSPGLDTVTSQSAFFADVTAFLKSLAASQPLVVVLEDVHWADPASLELLRHIASGVARWPVLMLVTYRIDELTRQHPFYRHLPSLVRESEGLRLDLRRLDENDLDALVALHYALGEEDRQRLVAYLVRYAEGNPLCALELLRSLEEEEHGGLIRTSDGWELAALDRIRVPQLMRQIIDARVARLGEATRQVLTIAAIIGPAFSVDVLASIAGMPHDDVYAAIDRAIEGHLVTEARDGDDVEFVHALIREALYESLPPHRRRHLHRHLAEMLERRAPIETDAIAWHYQQAGDSRAPAWLTRAGDRAQRAYAWLTARDRFADAATLLADVPGEELTRARLLYRCGRLQRYSNAPDAIECLRTATQLAMLAGDAVLAADATYSQGLVQCFADDWTHGLPAMAAGIDTLLSLPPRDTSLSTAAATWIADALPTIETGPAADDAPQAVRAVPLGINRHKSLVWFLAAAGHLDESGRLAARYRQDNSTVGTDPVTISNTGHALLGDGIALASRGDPDGARAAFSQARRSYEAIDHHACLAFTLLTELTDVSIPYRAGNIAERRRLASAAEREIERSRGALPADLPPTLAQLMVLFLDGRWDDACAIAARSGNYGTYSLRRQVTHTIPHIARYRGEPEDAWSHAHALLPDGPDTEPGSAVLLDALMLQQLAAHLCLDAGDLDGAKAWLEANDRWLAWSESALGHASNALAWARHAGATGDAAAARDRAQRALRDASEPRQPLQLMQARRFLGHLLHEAGELAEAESHLTAALALATACEATFERALSLEACAHLRASTNPEDASSLAREALGIARDLGAIPAIERIERFIEACDHDAERAGSPLVGLTAREVEVLRLVAQGMTDAEVAERLYISPRTVGQHLRSIYNKLDVRSRTEAARIAIERGVG